MNFVGRKCIAVAAIGLLSFSNFAYSVKLEVASDAPLLVVLGADIILYAHILGGMIGLVAGVVASLSHKGGCTHRFSGQVFFYSMLISYAIALFVAPFLPVEQGQNTLAALLSLYLLLSAFHAAKNRAYQASWVEKAGLIFSLSIIVACAIFIKTSGPDVDTGVFYMFVVVSAIAFLGDLSILIRKSISQRSRIVRHVWRICFTFFIASGSLFFGQGQLFPLWFNESAFPQLFAMFPIVMLLIWVPIVFMTNAMSKRRTTVV